MGKAKIYGKATAYTPNKRRDLRYIKKNTRNRERAMPSLVAGQTPKRKEAQPWPGGPTAQIVER